MSQVSRRVAVALGALVVAVAAAGVTGAVARSSADRDRGGSDSLLTTGLGDQRLVTDEAARSGLTPAAPVPVPEATTTTLSAPVPPSAVTTVPPSVAVSPPPIAAPPPPPTVPSATATSAPPTTMRTATTSTTLPPATTERTFALSPASGPANSRITASGTGCLAGGAPTGVGLNILDPEGEPVTGDGGGARPDGTWSVPFGIYGDPGVYTVEAFCQFTSGGVVFSYPPQTFTITA
jgi:hypothetical protein